MGGLFHGIHINLFYIAKLIHKSTDNCSLALRQNITPFRQQNEKKTWYKIFEIIYQRIQVAGISKLENQGKKKYKRRTAVFRVGSF